MGSRILIAFLLVVAFPLSGQASKKSSTQLPKKPRAILAAAAPLYNFADPSLKPWHMRVTYQLFDDKGKPTEKGTFEYWWASPKVYRMTWSRPGAGYTIWHSADGKERDKSIGDQLGFFESQLESALLSPLPTAKEVDPSKFRLMRQVQSVSHQKFPCVMVVPRMHPANPVHALSAVPLGLFPTYCFDPDVPGLRIVYSWGSTMEVFNRIAKMQGKYLPEEVQFFEAGHTILTANVKMVSHLDSSDPALKPAPDAKPVGKPIKVFRNEKSTNGRLLKKVAPIYPQDAKEARVSGTVVLDVVIGTDGVVHKIQIVKAPWPSLAASAVWAVSQWRYKPYLLNGKPVEVETNINVIFTMGR